MIVDRGMKQTPNKLRLRTGWLVAAAAFAITPLAAQDVELDPQPPPQTGNAPAGEAPPATQTARPPAVTIIPAVPAPEAPAADPEPADEPEAAESDTASPGPASTTRAPSRSTSRAAEASPAGQTAAEEPAADPAPGAFQEVEPVPGLVTGTLPSPETVPPDEIADEPPQGALWPWLLAGALLIAALALLLVRRRRAGAYDFADRSEEPAGPVTTTPEPVTASGVSGVAAAAGASTLIRRVRSPDTEPVGEAVPTIEPPLAAELAGAPIAAAPIAAAATAESGRPRLELRVRPLRAGVGDEAASVEFELRIDNRGNGSARDLGVATWIYAAGAGEPSEAERRLIEHPANGRIEEIGAGESRRLQITAALPVARIHGDSVLPVVVVDIRYRRNDGKEERSTAQFAVGVPLEGELAHFDLENPSGLHEGVEARPVGAPSRG